MENTSSRLARSAWTLYIKAQRKSVLKALAVETDPERQIKLQSKLVHYQTMLAGRATMAKTGARASQ